MKSSRLCMVLLVAEGVLVIVSWLLSALRLEVHVVVRGYSLVCWWFFRYCCQSSVSLAIAYAYSMWKHTAEWGDTTFG